MQFLSIWVNLTITKEGGGVGYEVSTASRKRV